MPKQVSSNVLSRVNGMIKQLLKDPGDEVDRMVLADALCDGSDECEHDSINLLRQDGWWVLEHGNLKVLKDTGFRWQLRWRTELLMFSVGYKELKVSVMSGPYDCCNNQEHSGIVIPNRSLVACKESDMKWTCQDCMNYLLQVTVEVDVLLVHGRLLDLFGSAYMSEQKT